MQKKRIVLVLIAIFLVLAGIGGTKKVIEIRQEAQKERQVAFLKAHEKELVDFIKKYSSQEETVEFDWETVEAGKGMAFTKPTLIVKFNISDSSEKKYNDQGYVLRVDTDINKLNKIDALMVLNDPIYSNIQGEDQ